MDYDHRSVHAAALYVFTNPVRVIQASYRSHCEALVSVTRYLLLARNLLPYV
jgi:hypothetical protein